MEIYKANLYRLFTNLIKIFTIVVVIFSVTVYLIYFQTITDAEFLYKIYSAMATFFWVVYFIITNGELFEKNIIRYYVETEPKRYKIIFSLCLENIILYMLTTFMFLAILWLGNIVVSMQTIILYFCLYLLYLIVTLNILVLFKKTSTAILLSLLILWILPNLVNYVLVDTGFYDVQLFYYLSPDTFITDNFKFSQQIIYGGYLLLLFTISLVLFAKEEL